MYLRKYCSQRAPTAPSTVRWSALIVTAMKVLSLNLKRNISQQRRQMNRDIAASYPFKAFSSITRRFCGPPTAKMHDCGGLMIALKWVTSNMPKLETVKVPPWNSCGCNFPSLALAASDLTSFEIFSIPLRSALKTIGVMRPLSVETATDTSTASNLQESRKCQHSNDAGLASLTV